MKTANPAKNLWTENFTHTKKFCVLETATVDLSKIYFLKKRKENM